MSRLHLETHQTQRVGWLRAAVLGANDGIVSTASLLMGVAAAGASTTQITTTGLAGLVAGSLSMAAGEYVSVQAQADTEAADLAKESAELLAHPAHEHAELAAIYQGRGLSVATANAVATELMAHNALDAHARDELGITPALKARPYQAAASSAAAFAAGAALPLLAVLATPDTHRMAVTCGVSVLALGALGAIAAQAGGGVKATILQGALRMTLWGGAAMGLTAGIGLVFGVAA